MKAHVKNGRLLLDEPTDLPEGAAVEVAIATAAEVLTLPVDERARLARDLILSLDEAAAEDPADVERAWGEEIRRRVDDLKSGRVEGIPADAVFAEIRASLAARRR